MATAKSITFLLLLSIFLLSTSLVLSTSRLVEDDWEKQLQQELQECKQYCRQLTQEDLQRPCKQLCQDLYEEVRREHKGGNEGRDEPRRPDPQQQYREEEREKELQQCRQQCRQQQGQQQQWQCEQECRDRYEEAARLEECRQQCSRRPRSPEEQWKCQRKCQQERERNDEGIRRSSSSSKEENNPYFFGQESFIHTVRTQHGSIRVLKNFLKRSKLLMGIANYRLAIFEADPRTFAVPKQSDAEQIFVVTQGEGTVTLLRNEGSRESYNIRRESHNIRKGDIIRVHAGTVVYIINSSNNQKLQIVKLVQPVSTPGHFEDFYIGGGDNPESFYRTFSTRILEAALNTQQEKLEKLFGRQKEGEIVEASEEQIRAMSGQPSEGGQKPFNLLQKRPDHSNQWGQLYTADFDDYEELRDLDVHVSFTNITGGSMMAPFFESKASLVVMVVDGQAEFEMVSPHLSSQGQEERARFQKVTSRLTQGNVFIIPAGHPTTIIASQEQNLQVVFFKVYAENSRKVFLAGRNNVVNQMEREAKELSFGVSSQLVEDVFGGSKDEVFVRGPRQSQERRPFWSSLAFE